MRARARAYRLKNLDEVKRRYKEWCRRNPQSIANYGANRRARERNAVGSYTIEQIADLARKQNYKCANCLKSIRKGFHRDHIVPLSRGGSNYISNIQLLCASCNCSKHNKDPIEFAQKNGRLL
jgi:5-methylcytosine-specific restriction endonuclease McrA